MTVATRRRSRTPASDEAVAGARVVLGLTIGIGGMACVVGLATGQPLILIGLPTLLLVLSTVRGLVPLAGWSGVAVWAALIPTAHGEAVAVPLAMMVICLAIAVGPGELLSWFARDAAPGLHPPEPGAPVVEGWIEEDVGRIG